jgi:hypothetical protein
MSTDKLKPNTLKPAKASATKKSTETTAVSPGTGVQGDKMSRKTTHKLATVILTKPAISKRLLSALGPLLEVNITDARSQIPKMIRSSVGGKVYLIGNAKSADSPTAVLIGMAELERVVQEVARTSPSRTLGEVLATLPFSGMKLQPLRAKPLPNDGLPMAHLSR